MLDLLKTFKLKLRASTYVFPYFLAHLQRLALCHDTLVSFKISSSIWKLITEYAGNARSFEMKLSAPNSNWVFKIHLWNVLSLFSFNVVINAKQAQWLIDQKAISNFCQARRLNGGKIYQRLLGRPNCRAFWMSMAFNFFFYFEYFTVENEWVSI